jgi:hypothetical protein
MEKMMCEAVDQFRRQFPNIPIVRWEYVNQDDTNLVTIYTDNETLTVQYDPAMQQSMIVGMKA